MDEPALPLLATDRDGTSQAQRALPALLTDYVAIDNRNFKDQLVMAFKFAQELKYFNLDNVEAGNWEGLIYPGALQEQHLTDTQKLQNFWTWLNQIESFIQQPENYADESYTDLHRPHFVLFLTFLQLLKNTQVQLNQLTARHLEFYYRNVLDFKLKPSQPDRVSILITPSAEVNKTLLPAGTQLAAGKDSSGKDLVYLTDTDLVVNQINIARLSSVYVNKQVIGIREAREQNAGTKNESVMAMLKMALGDPAPGDDLPLYPPNLKVKDFSFLTGLQSLVKLAGKGGLYMELGELRGLIQLKANRTGAAADRDWQAINAILTKAGKQRAGSSFALKNTDSKDRHFDDNLKDALGVSSLTDYFNANSLNLVKNIDQLYDQLTRDDVLNLKELNDFINNKLFLNDVEDFRKMMGIKRSIDKEWQEIFFLLQRAGQRMAPPVQCKTPGEPPDFEDMFKSVFGSVVYPFGSVVNPAVPDGLAKISNLDSFYQALLDIEAYFYMPLEDFGLLMDLANPQSDSSNPENLDHVTDSLWTKVYEKLSAAHQKKGSVARKAQLINLRPEQTSTAAQSLALQKMMQLALGIPDTDTSDLVNRVKALLSQGTDLSLLENATKGIAELADMDWDSIGSLLELAWRNRVPIPVAQTSSWLSLSAVNDNLTAKVPGSNDDASHWYTFGQRSAKTFTTQSQLPATVTLGWAISSPLLCLAQGQRVVTLMLVFRPDQFNSQKIGQLLANAKITGQPFSLELSTAKGWITGNRVSVETGDYQDKFKTLSWTLTFDEGVDPITALPDMDSGGIKAPWPILRLLLQPRLDTDSKSYVTDYSLLKDLFLEKALLTVDVKGLSECKLQNDDQTLPSGKPFEPFGSSPAIGARLNFAHSELSLKKLEKFDITLQWMGVPSDNLGDYYQHYLVPNSDPKAPITTGSFTSKITLVDQRLELNLDTAPLFSDNATKPATLSINDVRSKIQEHRDGYIYERQLTPSSDEEVTAWPRYWFLELSGCDFQHTAYPGVAAAKAIELAAVIANNASAAEKDKVTLSAEAYKVNPPYTPKLKSFSINYSASIELNGAELENEDADHIYHIHPFGYAHLQFDQQAGGYRFLPAYDNEGELYIGLSGVDAPETLSMLLQMAEGTANPDLEPAKVQWSVLNGNRWQPLDQGQLQQDATNGLLQSGIVKLQLDAVAPSTLLPPDLYWLRVAVDRGCDSVCDSVGIETQAVTATFFDQENADDHLNQPLPANTIQNLVVPITDIALVRQPYTSIAAKPKEQDSIFNTRVSERLRHKQRAVSYWDYERLVLEHYPEIYKAKCIPADLQENRAQVTIVVIPDVRNRLPFNPFEPKAPVSVLEDIGAYLNAYAPLGASIKVKNALFQEVRLRFAVQFLPGSDSGYYKQQLNQEVNHFLSPWAYEQGKDIIIGGKLYANAIIDFIERRPYVDYVANFKFFRVDDHGVPEEIAKPSFNIGTDAQDFSSSIEGYAITANGPDAVLVASRNHDIDLITEMNFGEQLFNKGINYMKIELDFKVG